MALHSSTMDALLSWVNSLKVDKPIEQLSQLQDLSILIKIATKLRPLDLPGKYRNLRKSNGNTNELTPILQQSLEDRLKYLRSFLQRYCRYGSSAENLVQWQKILQGENVEVELSKVIVLLFYYSNMKTKNPKECEDFDLKTQTELASILRFVLENEDDLSLNDKLLHFLQKKARFPSSSDGASSSDDSVSPNVLIKRKTEVRFLELHRVASSSAMKSLTDSPSSPMIEVLHMPQFQMRRLKKQLTEEQEFRDELELELSENKKRLAEKEAQLFLMQQRIDRLLVLSEKQTEPHEPRELEELREKNESLMIRLRDTLKQCQDLKTDKNQLERKNDQLAEENGDLAFKVRDLSSRLAQLQDALNETTEEHDTSLAGWQQRQSQLETELNAAISQKKCLEEQQLILQGKVSILEDQLKKLGESASQDKGERLGDVLKLESLQQEVVALTSKCTALESQITRLEKEKIEAIGELEMQRSRLESEKMQLQDIVTNLQTSLSEITFQNERQNQEAKAQEEKLTCQITTLKLEMSKMSTSIMQKDKELLGLHHELEEERKQNGLLVETIKKQEEISKQNIEGLNHQVDQLSTVVRQSEDKMVDLTQKLECETQHVAHLKQECKEFVQERDSTLTTFNEYKLAKEDELGILNNRLHHLEENHQTSLAAVEKLKREKAELSLKVQELDATILDLIAKCQNLDSENDTQGKAHAKIVESLKSQLIEQESKLKVYEQKMSGMEFTTKENAQLKENLFSMEDAIKILKEQLEDEKTRYANYVESEGKLVSKLQEDLKKLSDSRDQTLGELNEEKASSKRLESQLKDLEEEYRHRNEHLQVKLSETSSAIKHQQAKQEELTMEVDKWKSKYEEAQQGIAQNSCQMEEQIERLKQEHSAVCHTLEKEKAKSLELESQAQETMSVLLEKMSKVECELSKALSNIKEKEIEEQKLRSAVQSLEEKLVLHQQAEKEQLSQLEARFSKATQELQILSKELSEEKLQKTELECKIKQQEEQKSEKMSVLQSKMSTAQAAIKEREGEAQKLCEEVKLLKNQLEESNVKYQEVAAQKAHVITQLGQEKERALADLAAEKISKIEVEAQLQKSLDTHKNEFSSLQNELSRSLDLITLKESELERLTKDATLRENQLHLEQQKVAKLTGDLTTLKAFEERSSMLEENVKNYVQNAKTMEAEITSLKAAVCEKDKEIHLLEHNLKSKEKDNASFQEQYQATLGEMQVLQANMAELAKKCSEQDQAIVRAHKEAAEAKAMVSEKISVSERQQEGIEDLEAKIQREQQKTCELMKQLEDARSSQADTESSFEALKKELFHKVQELEQSQKALNDSNIALSSALSKSHETEQCLTEARENAATYHAEVGRKTEEIASMEAEVKSLTSKVITNKKSSMEFNELLVREQNKNTSLEGRIATLQADMNASSKELEVKKGVIENLNTEVKNIHVETEKQRLSLEELQKKLSSQYTIKEALEQEIQSWKQSCAQKEEQMSHLRDQLSSSQNMLEELKSLKSSNQELKAERTAMDKKHKEEFAIQQNKADCLQTELEKTKGELEQLLELKDTLSRQDQVLQVLQNEKASYVAQITELQQANGQLTVQNKALSEDQGAKNLEAELATIRQQHSQELQILHEQLERAVGEGKEQIEDLSKKLEAVTSKYDHAKTRVMDDRQKFQEERQKLLLQVEQLEAAKKEQSEQVQELNKQLSQQEKTLKTQQQKLKLRESEISVEVEKKQNQVTELESLLEQQTKAVEHYKTQMDKAKAHYDAKKVQNQELNEKLEKTAREQEQLCKENSELKMESDRLNRELQHSLLHSKEVEQNCKNLTNQVKTLEVQVEYADRQLRELGKFQVATDAMKGRETMGPPRETRRRGHADVSIDSLDLSDEDNPMNSTGKNGRSHQEAASSGSPDSLAQGRLPQKVESLESLYFTPIPTRVQSKMDSSIGSIGDLSLDSSKKTRSARRRTTQVINITMTKRTKEETVEPESANTSFYSLRSALSHQSLHQEKPRRGGRPQPAFSAPALSSLPSQESLIRPDLTSSDDSLNNSVLMNLPGYRPTTRSSARLSQGGRNSFYMSTCQDEPDPQEDWNRIAELQQRNRACPPHLKTSYPLESRPSVLAATITDEEVKTGDPKETLRRATLLPSQIQESTTSTRRMTLASSEFDHPWGGNITTRQQRKRVSEEPHHGPDTPESKKSASCFPRPMTPKDKHDPRKLSVAESKIRVSQPQTQASRRQTMTFSILNTPKKIGSSFLRKNASKKTETPQISPRTRGSSVSTSSTSSKSPLHAIRKSPSRRSPRVSQAKSPKRSNKFFERKQSKNK
ncbi:nuclear mitotic apparatus protein 1 isoform X4 [Pelobates fuscus]|uniref:nuclear mitotic apparatus protein 1 isoform X4 n=1 Tax=Pelobates fuscus TaxID=191477 RepID=UPI002FE49F1D